MQKRTSRSLKIYERCSEELYANKSDNFGEMDRFLERHKLPKLTKEGKKPE